MGFDRAARAACAARYDRPLKVDAVVRRGGVADRLKRLTLLAVLALGAGCAPGGAPAEGEVPLFGSSLSPSPGAPSPGSTLRWGTCGPKLECATLEVPLDYAHPGGRLVPLALARRPASGKRAGSLLANPGGPGESGIDDMDLFAALLTPSVLARFDLVTFDPRGVGQSDGVRCLDGPALDRYFHADPAPATAAAAADLLAQARALATGCASRSGDVLPFVGTENAARDMDRIRLALGETSLNYLGFSYGTLLGSTYADLFPSRVGRMVLDGAVDPALPPIATAEAQAVAYGRALSAFLADCQASPVCPWKPRGDLHAAYGAMMATLRSHPLAVGLRSVGPGEAFLGVARQLNSSAGWASLSRMLAALTSGNGAPLLASFDAYVGRQADGSYENTLQANMAINCLDQPWPSDPTLYARLAAHAAKVAPDFGAANVNSYLPCALWPVPPTGHPHPLVAPGSPPIVVVGSTGDPATPYEGAVALSHELQHGVLLTRVGQGHTGYEESACIRAAVDAFLVGGKVPAVGASCPV